MREFEAQARRAEELSRASPMQPVLRFVAGLCATQGRVAAALERGHADRPLTGRADADLVRVLEPVREVARYAARHGPDELAGHALARCDESDSIATTRLAVFWSCDRMVRDPGRDPGRDPSCDPREDFLSRAMLRPYLQLLRHLEIPLERARARGRCPYCGGPPSISCRRAASESDGAARSLLCAHCGFDWSFPRILCPGCFEADPAKLPRFADGSHPCASLEACETCRRYVKSIDLSRDARLLPEVDELGWLALDLWAVEEGFTRLEPGLAGL